MEGRGGYGVGGGGVGGGGGGSDRKRERFVCMGAHGITACEKMPRSPPRSPHKMAASLQEFLLGGLGG